MLKRITSSAIIAVAFLIYPLSLSSQNTFSLSLDANRAAGDQAVTSVNASPDQLVAIQIFGRDIRNANGVSVRFEYDATQVIYDGFDVGRVLPNAQALPEQGMNPTYVKISLVSFGGQALTTSGLIGTIRFRTTAAFSGTVVRLVRAELGRSGQLETINPNASVALQVQALTPDFDGDGMVGFADFVQFGGLFGSRRGDGRYQARYDLDSDGAIGFSDFVIFANAFGKPVSSSSGGGGGGGGGGTPPTSTPFWLDDDNGWPEGITYANNRFYVVDHDKKVYVYTSGGGRVPSADFNLDDDNGWPEGITYANNRFYVVDTGSPFVEGDEKVYVYTSGGGRVPSADFNLDDDNSDPGGITYANNRFYVVDTGNLFGQGDDKVYVYTSSGQRDVASDFLLDNRNSRAPGITYANNRFYVVDTGSPFVEGDEKVYVYTSDGGRDATSDFSLAGDNASPEGITYANNRFYVIDWSDEKGYAYTSDGGRDVASDFSLEGGNGDPYGITYANNRFYVVDERDEKVYVYTSDGGRDIASDFSLEGGNGDPWGITYANNRFYVVDTGEDKKVYVYTSGGGRDVASDFNLDSENINPGGITYANNRFYVVDYLDEKVYAYTSGGQRDAASDFSLEGGNGDPYGITYANNRFYVVDHDNKVYVYTSGGQRDAASDFSLEGDNDRPRGITYANNRFYVVDWTDDKVYVYTSGGTSTSGGGGGSSGSPDLVVESPSVSDNTLTTRQSFTLRATVRNRGTDQSASTTLRYYRSSNSTISRADTQVGTDIVSGLSASGTSAESISLNAPSSSGTYYYGACVASVAGESDTDNNCSTGVRVTVSGSGGTPPTSTSFTLDGNNRVPSGIVYANNRFYVVDLGNLTNLGDEKVYVYTSDGQRDVVSDFWLAGENSWPLGITYANNRFYVVDYDDAKVYVYTSGGQRDVVSDFWLAGDNDTPSDITYTNNRFYVVDSIDNKVYVYTSGGQRDAALDFNLDGDNRLTQGITYANNRFYVVDYDDDKVYVYTSGGGRDAASDFSLDSNNNHPGGITYANNRFYVVDFGADKVYVYTSGGTSVGGGGSSGGGNFNIELVFVNESDFTSSQKAVFRQAARRWMSIIIGDLRDIDFSRNPYNRWDEDLATIIRVHDTVDDLRIFVRAMEIDGANNALGKGGPLFIRRDSNLPVLGWILLDTADLQSMEAEGKLEALVLHEMGHVLGFGTLWDVLNLLRGSSDKHFTGPLSIQAFDNAGGRNYTGAKVPTERDDGHWRESVLGVELMTPRLDHATDPLSAITIQSLADLGYRVDVRQADAYSLPALPSGKRVGGQSRTLGDCLLKGPIYVVDENGRIIHTIRK